MWLLLLYPKYVTEQSIVLINMERKKRCIDQDTYISTFSEINYLSLLNVDMLLYFIKFLHPIDRFNLALSGTLGGVKDECRELYFANSFRLVTISRTIDTFKNNSMKKSQIVLILKIPGKNPGIWTGSLSYIPS